MEHGACWSIACWHLGNFWVIVGATSGRRHCKPCGEMGNTMYSYLRAGEGKGRRNIFAYFCELLPCCAPRTEVSSIMVVAFSDHRSEDASSLRVEGSSLPLLQGPTHHRLRYAAGYTIVGYKLYARTRCARMQHTRASTSFFQLQRWPVNQELRVSLNPSSLPPPSPRL